MKQTLLPIILLIGLVGRGQTNTIPVILLVSDTSHYQYSYFTIEACPDSVRQKSLFISCGHEVKKDYRNESPRVSLLWGFDVVSEKTAPFGHIEFLDSNKKPLSKNIVVWNALPRPSPRTATAWASLQNEVNELKKRMDSLIKALRERDKPQGLFIPGKLLVTADSSFLSGDINNVQDLFDPESGLTLKASPYGISRGFAIPPDPDQCFIKVVQEKAFADGIDYGRLYAHIADKHGHPIPGYQPVFKIIGGSAADNLINVVMTQEGTAGTDAEGNCYVRITSIHPGLAFITVTTTKGEDILTKERMADPYVMFR